MNLPALAALTVAAGGLIWLAFQPPRFRFVEHQLGVVADAAIPLNITGTSRDDFLLRNQNTLILVRLEGNERRAVAQMNFPRGIGVFGALDVTGDGRDEIYAALRDSSGAVAVLLDGEGDTLQSLGPVKGPSWAAREPWDGWLVPMAGFVRDGRQKVVCRVLAMFARQPRGVAVYDLQTGVRDWFFAMGAWPDRAYLVDLNGDGERDILLESSSPANGAIANGTDDEHAYALALNQSGARLWQSELAGKFASVFLLPLPVGSAPGPLIVAATHSHEGDPPASSTLSLMDGRSGRILKRLRFARSLTRPFYLESGRPGFVVGGNDSTIRIYDLNLSLEAQRRVDGEVEVWAAIDLDADAEPEIVASTRDAILVLDRQLRPRGRLSTTEKRLDPTPVRVARADLLRSRLSFGEKVAVAADALPDYPIDDPDKLALVGVGAAAAGYGIRRVATRLPRRRRIPAGVTREVLTTYAFLVHGQFQQERPFERLRLWVQARCAGIDRPPWTLQGILEEWQGSGRAALEAFLRRLADAGAPPARLGRIRRLTHAFVQFLEDAARAPDHGQLGLAERALTAADALVLECCRAYWEVARRAACRADHATEQAVRARRARLSDLNIASDLRVEPGGDRLVLFERDALVSVVGELVDNAINALRGRARAELHVVVAPEPSDSRYLAIIVQDNGPGVLPERRGALFTPQGATRPGGGRGLHLARECARSWLGDLTYEPAPCGSGSVFRLRLKVVTGPESAMQ